MGTATGLGGRHRANALRPGTPAKVAGPFGGFAYRRGGDEQIWIAGGIGITPFISWIRSLDRDFDREVAFFYSLAHESDGLYLDEMQQAAAEHPTFVPRIVVTDCDGFLTADKVAAGRSGLADVWVYMCGPPAMTKALAADFRRLGVPRARVRWEQFGAR